MSRTSRAPVAARALFVLASVPLLTVGPAVGQDTADIDAIQELVGALAHEDRRAAAASELFELGAAGVEPLAWGLVEDWPYAGDTLRTEARRLAREVLRELAPVAAEVIPILRRADDSATRHRLVGELAPFSRHRRGLAAETGPGVSAWFLERLRFDARGELGRIVLRLEDERRFVADIAAQVVACRAVDVASDAWMRDTAVQALAARVPLAEGPKHRDYRGWAERALARLAPEHPQAVAGHALDAGRHPSRVVRAASVRALGVLGSAGGAVAQQALVRALDDPETMVVAEAILAIGILEAAADGIAGHLQRFVVGEDRALAARSRASLRRVVAGGGDAQLATTWSDEGMRLSRGRMDGLQRVGPWRYWWPTGAERSYGEYRDGKEHGRWVLMRVDGSAEAEGEYVDGKPDGSWVYWQANGRKAREGKFVDGKAEGEWVFFHRNGRRKSTMLYRNGEESGVWTYWDENGVRRR